MTGDETNSDTTGEFDIVIDEGEAIVRSETETREIDIDGDGVPDGVRTVNTETRESDIDGDGWQEVFMPYWSLPAVPEPGHRVPVDGEQWVGAWHLRTC